jgi:hypothetical protein
VTGAKRTATTLLVTLVVTAGSLLFAAPAHAGHYHRSVTGLPCPSGYFCAWTGSNQTGAGAGYIDSEDNWDHTANHGSADRITSSEPELDNASASIHNNGTGTSFEHVLMFTDYGYGGSSGCIPKGVSGNLEQFRVSSHRWYDGANCAWGADGESHPENDVH